MVQGQIDLYLFEVLLLKFLDPLEFLTAHASVALPPFIKGRSAYPIFPTDLGGGLAVIDFLQDLGNLGG